MCGIVGLLEPSTGERASLLRRMNARLVHRGPDEDGLHEVEHIGMAMRRLSIQDVAHGHQPARSESGSVVAMLNGEIYNVRELQEMLRAKGHRLESDGDTELIPHLYEEYGLGFVDHLRGMFVVAVWDADRQRLVLARDRLGKKPLYYRSHGENLSWASELKALLVDERLERRANPVAISHYLTYQYVPAPWSAVEGVSKLPPGHMLVHADGVAHVTRYWTLNYAPIGSTSDRTDAELAAEVRERLVECVRVRMISERPVGAFLSGGLDSSAVVAAMRHAGVSDIRTFSIGFEHETFNELPFARRVAQAYETEHHELVVRADAMDLLPQIAGMFDEPYADSSAIPSWYLAKMTRDEVVVALTGDGGDEALGGYQRFEISMRAPQFRLHSLAAASLRAVGGRIGTLRGAPRQVDRIGKAAMMLGETTPERRYGRFVSYFRPEEKLALASDHFARVVAEHDSYALVEDVWNRYSGTDLVNRLLAVDTHTYLPGDLNAKVDITTMSVSLEARSPFLDHTFVEWAASLPGARKILPGKTKHLLKLALEGWIDDDLIHRTKTGFGIPLDAWLRGPLKDLVHDALTDTTARSRGYFQPTEVERLINQQALGAAHGSRVYALLMLELWHRQVLDVAS